MCLHRGILLPRGLGVTKRQLAFRGFAPSSGACAWTPKNRVDVASLFVSMT